MYVSEYTQEFQGKSLGFCGTFLCYVRELKLQNCLRIKNSSTYEAYKVT